MLYRLACEGLVLCELPCVAASAAPPPAKAKAATVRPTAVLRPSMHSPFARVRRSSHERLRTREEQPETPATGPTVWCSRDGDPRDRPPEAPRVHPRRPRRPRRDGGGRGADAVLPCHQN